MLLLALGACNMAVSDHPMFTTADRLTTPLKDGLWAGDDPECAVDMALPKEKWPKCAAWLVIRGNEVVDFWGDEEKDEDRPVGFFMANGQPPIVQIKMVEKDKHSFLFAAIEPTTRDAAGAVTALNLWFVPCGTEKVPGSSSQIDPYPGFDKDCRPLTASALRTAAVAGRPKADPGRMKWLRAEAP
jgi:hypothetical protein